MSGIVTVGGVGEGGQESQAPVCGSPCLCEMRTTNTSEPMGVPTKTMPSQHPRGWCGDPGRCWGKQDNRPAMSRRKTC
eukprot:6171986-Pleurochrysis_carterae.AAC.3